MNVRLHPCIRHNPLDYYWSETVFELDKWYSDLASIIEAAKPIDLPVWINWTPGDHELRGIPGQPAPDKLGAMRGAFDPECTWLVEAWVLKCLTFHKDEWHPDRIARSKAISAYLGALPDDWPVIVHYV